MHACCVATTSWEQLSDSASTAKRASASGSGMPTHTAGGPDSAIAPAKSPAERGATTPALLATLPDEQFLSGGLYLEEQEIKWDYSGVTRAL